MNTNEQPTEQQPSESAQYANQISEIWTDEWRKIKAAFEAGQTRKPASESALDKAPTRAPREDTTTFEERGLIESKRQRFNERLNQVMNGKPDEQSKAHERIKALEKKCRDYAIAQEGNLAKLDELNAKQADLLADYENLKSKFEQDTDHWNGLVNDYKAENEQLRSERDKMREALEESREVVITVMAVIEEDAYDSIRAYKVGNDFLRKASTLLSGGSKQ